MQLFIRAGAIAVALLLSAGTALAQQATSASVAIVVNGSPVQFDQPPVEQAGRVFVPLRGVFQQLGASVVYANGTINAQGHGRSVSLHLGSTQATVNGQVTYLDQAPFLIGARTLVPLRFVAQALGATVNYNGNNQTVYVGGGGGGYHGPPGQGAPMGPMPNRSFRLMNVLPMTQSDGMQPRIGADFSQAVDRDSIHIFIDGNDVTREMYLNGGGTSFYITPRVPLGPGSHIVRVTGTTKTGIAFDRNFSFATHGAP